MLPLMPWRVRIATHNDCAPMIVYLATKAEFRADILSNRIEELIYQLNRLSNRARVVALPGQFFCSTILEKN